VTVHIIYNSFGESSVIIFCLLEDLFFLSYPIK